MSNTNLPALNSSITKFSRSIEFVSAAEQDSPELSRNLSSP
jgi:hypothetical protein